MLLSATHNIEAITPENVAPKQKLPWDLAMAYVVRNFDALPQPSNPFDAACILDEGYAPIEKFTADNFSGTQRPRPGQTESPARSLAG